MTKAVHSEVVSELTTEDFLNTLKRFIARWRKCQNVYSDCGSNFIGAHNKVREFYELFNNVNFKERVNSCLTNEGIRWNFIPVRSPHFGCLWKSHIRSAKYYLKGVIGNACLTFEELTTGFTNVQ